MPHTPRMHETSHLFLPYSCFISRLSAPLRPLLSTTGWARESQGGLMCWYLSSTSGLSIPSPRAFAQRKASPMWRRGRRRNQPDAVVCIKLRTGLPFLDAFPISSHPSSITCKAPHVIFTSIFHFPVRSPQSTLPLSKASGLHQQYP